MSCGDNASNALIHTTSKVLPANESLAVGKCLIECVMRSPSSKSHWLRTQIQVAYPIVWPFCRSNLFKFYSKNMILFLFLSFSRWLSLSFVTWMIIRIEMFKWNTQCHNIWIGTTRNVFDFVEFNLSFDDNIQWHSFITIANCARHNGHVTFLEKIATSKSNC